MSALKKYKAETIWEGEIPGNDTAPPLEVYLAADMEAALKDARVLAEWFTDIAKRGNPMPVKEATRLLARLSTKEPPRC